MCNLPCPAFPCIFVSQGLPLAEANILAAPPIFPRRNAQSGDFAEIRCKRAEMRRHMRPRRTPRGQRTCGKQAGFRARPRLDAGPRFRTARPHVRPASIWGPFPCAAPPGNRGRHKKEEEGRSRAHRQHACEERRRPEGAHRRHLHSPDHRHARHSLRGWRRTQLRTRLGHRPALGRGHLLVPPPRRHVGRGLVRPNLPPQRLLWRQSA